MALPKGLTCGDCVHIARCQSIFGHVPEDTYCDWFPRKFRPVTDLWEVCERSMQDRRATDGELLGMAAVLRGNLEGRSPVTTEWLEAMDEHLSWALAQIAELRVHVDASEVEP